MYDKATRRFAVLVVAMYLTSVLGLSVVTATLNTTGSSQVVAGQQKSPAPDTHTSPKRDTIVSTKPWYVRAQARIWFHQNIDGYHAEWKCIDNIIHKESRWIPNLYNTQGSGAYGLGQVKNSAPYTKNKPLKQFKVAIKYAIHKYGTLCNAWHAWQRQGWY